MTNFVNVQPIAQILFSQYCDYDRIWPAISLYIYRASLHTSPHNQPLTLFLK